jgi:hypothetical protein
MNMSLDFHTRGHKWVFSAAVSSQIIIFLEIFFISSRESVG